MGLNVGSPYIPPDDVLLNTNSTTGALQLKPGTRGDVLYAGASGVWATLPKGTAGQYLSQGANDPAWSAPPGEGWSYLGKLSPSAVASVTSGALAAYSEYLLRVKVISSATQTFSLQLNGDAGATYNHVYISNTTVVNAGGSTSCVVGQGATTQGGYLEICIEGVTKAIASGGAGIRVQSGVAAGSGIQGLSGLWSGGNATQVSTVTLLASAGTFTGTIEIFGRNIA